MPFTARSRGGVGEIGRLNRRELEQNDCMRAITRYCVDKLDCLQNGSPFQQSITGETSVIGEQASEISDSEMVVPVFEM